VSRAASRERLGVDELLLAGEHLERAIDEDLQAR
jgi:hypothetical protein